MHSWFQSDIPTFVLGMGGSTTQNWLDCLLFGTLLPKQIRDSYCEPPVRLNDYLTNPTRPSSGDTAASASSATRPASAVELPFINDMDFYKPSDMMETGLADGAILRRRYLDKMSRKKNGAGCEDGEDGEEAIESINEDDSGWRAARKIRMAMSRTEMMDRAVRDQMRLVVRELGVLLRMVEMDPSKRKTGDPETHILFSMVTNVPLPNREKPLLLVCSNSSRSAKKAMYSYHKYREEVKTLKNSQTNDSEPLRPSDLKSCDPFEYYSTEGGDAANAFFKDSFTKDREIFRPSNNTGSREAFDQLMESIANSNGNGNGSGNNSSRNG